MAKAEKKPAKKSTSKIDDLSVNTENGETLINFALISAHPELFFSRENSVSCIHLENL